MARFLIFVLITGFFFFISNIWITTLYLDVTYKINKELKMSKELRKEKEKLETQVKMLTSPEHIIKIAKNKLHLKFAKNSQVRIVDE